jgi:hypothetical protein
VAIGRSVEEAMESDRDSGLTLEDVDHDPQVEHEKSRLKLAADVCGSVIAPATDE